MCIRIIAAPALRRLTEQEASAHEDIEVVARCTVPETQGPDDRPEVVPREPREVIVDSLTGRVLKAIDRSGSSHKKTSRLGIRLMTLGTSPLYRTRE